MIDEIQATALVFMFALFFAVPVGLPEWVGTFRLWLYRMSLLTFVGTTLYKVWL